MSGRENKGGLLAVDEAEELPRLTETQIKENKRFILLMRQVLDGRFFAIDPRMRWRKERAEMHLQALREHKSL